jgi:hypothetical protein
MRTQHLKADREALVFYPLIQSATNIPAVFSFSVDMVERQERDAGLRVRTLLALTF